MPSLTPSHFRRSLILFSASLLIALSAAAQAQTQIIRLVTVEEHQEATRHYYTDLLATAFARMPGDYTLEIVGDVPQTRAQRMLENGQIDVFWMVESLERDETFLSTGVGISDGLIGERVLMIRPEDQPMFDDVQSLADFRALKLTAGFGQGWVDGRVWGANDLDYFEETGDWSVMFPKLARNRGDFDYLSRSVKEIMVELAKHPALMAEQNLLLVYDRDEAFYVPPGQVGLQNRLRTELLAMEADGTLHQFMRQYWGDAMDALNRDARRRIDLVSPE